MLSRRQKQHQTNRQRKVGELNHSWKPADRMVHFQVAETPEVLLCSDPMVHDALLFIKAGARRCLQVEDVAEHVNTSRSTLIRRFSRALGRSVSSEIRRQQVIELKRLLTQTSRTIEQISVDCRFSSPGQLSRFFKCEVGVSPSEYRRGVRVPDEMTLYQV